MPNPHAFLRRLEQGSAGWTPEHRATFAAIVASRHARDLGEDGDRPRAMIEDLWRAARGRALTSSSVATFVAELRDVAELVDPDRVRAFDVYRALAVLQDALMCASGDPATGPLDLARAALGARAGASPRQREAILPRLEACWSWDAVEAEARWLEGVASALTSLPSIDEAAVETLRRGLASGD